MIVLDLVEKSIKRKILLKDFPGIGNTSVLYIKKYNKVYFKGEGSLYSTSLDNIELEAIPFPEKSFKRENDFFCHTGISHNEKYNYLVWGCSPNFSGLGKDLLYGEKGSRSGFIQRVFLDKEGNPFKPKRTDTFETSKKLSKRAFSGISTGVWGSGGKLTVTENGDILVATGNGPSYPSKGNFGCSILLLDGGSLQIKEKRASFSLDGKETQECFFQNKDFSSSTFSSVKLDNLEKHFILGKPGLLLSFSTGELISGLKVGKNIFPQFLGRKGKSYGRPLIVKEGKRNFLSTLHSSYHNVDDEFLPLPEALKESYERISNIKIEKVGCMGHLKKGRGKLSLIYSGKVRDIPVLLNPKKYGMLLESKFKGDFLKEFSDIIGPTAFWGQDERSWANFVNIESFEGSFFDSAPKNEKILSEEDFIRCQLRVSDCGLLLEKGSSKDSKSFLIIDEGKSCRKIDGSLPIYTYRKIRSPHLEFKGERFVLNGFELSPSGIPRRIWSIVGKPGDTVPNSNMGVWKDPKGKSSAFLLIVNRGGRNVLEAYTVKDGRILFSTEIRSTIHFSEISSWKNLIFVPTKDFGIQIFQVGNENY